MVAEGRRLFRATGCAGCHGQDAQGTKIAPPLQGHTEQDVLRQVRAPLGQMPAYSETKLSDADLHKIAEYIRGLAPEKEHVEPTELLDPLVAHHWMAITAIKAGDAKEALHHVRHITPLVKGAHLSAMNEAAALLRRAELHEAEHIIERMLAGQAKPDLTAAELDLQLALSALKVRDVKDAEHEMRHFLEVAKGEQAHEGRHILEDLHKGEAHEAEHRIEDLLSELHK
jgi:hypothetical protein